MWAGLADEFGEVGAPVVGYGEALADIEAILLGCVLRRISLLLVQPALDSPANTVERQFSDVRSMICPKARSGDRQKHERLNSVATAGTGS